MKKLALENLVKNIKSSESWPSSNEVNIKTVGMWLCGMNYKLAENPFSEEFLCNVAFNGSDSMYGILWLQLNVG